MTTPIANAQAVDLAAESVAGEEDPGASLELPPRGAAAAAKPVGNNEFCRACGGGGMLNGGPCPDCEGTGRVGSDPAA